MPAAIATAVPRWSAAVVARAGLRRRQRYHNENARLETTTTRATLNRDPRSPPADRGGRRAVRILLPPGP